MPIHDKHNIRVYGWPLTLKRLVNPYRRECGYCGVGGGIGADNG